MRDSTSWVISGTKTFRLGSRKILHKFGGNLQNIEKSMREIYIPDDGKIFVQTDQSGAEALIVAYLCEAGSFRQLFLHGVKPHVYVALHVFKDVWKKKMKEKGITGDVPLDIDAICKTPIQALKSNPYWRDLDLLIKDSDNWSLAERYYYLAKQTCHSSNYGIEPPTFRMNILEKSGGKIVISKEDSEHFLRTYHGLFPEIQDWHRRMRSQVEKTRMLYNLHGHPYTITSHVILETGWKELFAWVPQSTVGMITNIAYAKMQSFIERNKLSWDLLTNCNDSYLLQCPMAEVQECALKAKEFMEQEFESPVDSVKFRMRSETQAGMNWAPAKIEQKKNLMGLKEIKV
jgi:DNA polymerase I-like protein with 3'-5' exonuclease and polymerase domains